MTRRRLLSRIVPAGWRAALLTRRGRRRLRRGELRLAIQAFEGALVLRPERFRTLIDLATACLCARDLRGARLALSRARRADPAHFNARAGRRLARWGFDLEAVWRMTAHAPRTSTRPLSQPEPAVVRPPQAVAAKELPFGDCGSLDEYARFQAMPPISQAEMDSVDWDRVLGDLFDE